MPTDEALQPIVQQMSDRAVHDTVASIVQHAVYQRSLMESIGTRVWRWLWETIDRLMSVLTGSPIARTITVAALVVAAVVIVARILLEQRHVDGRWGARKRTSSVGDRDPWREAERLAAAGRYTDAAHALFNALLAVCAARGELRIHSSKTTGDYARELRTRRAPAHTAFQRFRRRYDHVVYGHMVCSADDYAELREWAMPVLNHERAA